tara:strand:+ start:6898 stop:7491 length:594 start_codon:yes stop_codon:yes gene_type:complete
MAQVQLKTKIKELLKQAEDPGKLQKAWDSTQGVREGVGSALSPIGHAWNQLTPDWVGTQGPSDMQKIKTYLAERKLPKGMLNKKTKEKAWQGFKEGTRGIGKTGLGLGMGAAGLTLGLPLAASGLVNYGPGAVDNAADFASGAYNVGTPGVAGALGGGIAGATAGHMAFGGRPWASLLGAGIGAATGGVAMHKGFGG